MPNVGQTLANMWSLSEKNKKYFDDCSGVRNILFFILNYLNILLVYDIFSIIILYFLYFCSYTFSKSLHFAACPSSVPGCTSGRTPGCSVAILHSSSIHVPSPNGFLSFRFTRADRTRTFCCWLGCEETAVALKSSNIYDVCRATKDNFRSGGGG